MHQQFYHLAQRIFNVPVAIHPQKSEIIVSALAERLGITNFSRLDGTEIEAVNGSHFDASQNRESDYDVHHGFAIIPVHGTLVHKLGSLRPYSGMTGYDGVRQNLRAAIDDPEVKGIVLDVDSPGGEVSGCFDLVDDIYALRSEKPITSILNENAYSAGYAIASAAHRVTIPRTGGAGSIGVIYMHVDYSQAFQEAGLKVTMIKYGEHKGAGAPEFPLSSEAARRLQKDIDMMGELFIETVARNRGMSAKKIREMQAATYTGKDAVDIGLADSVISPHLEFTNSIDAIT